MNNEHLSDSALDATEEQESAMLTPLEARVLGSLMEKQMTTPDQYPLTLNSLVTACNQKTSREPVMNLQPGEVQRCLNQLEERQLVAIEYGSRADKYDQRLSRQLVWNREEQAIFCLLLLRGPQTLNELLSRSHRMFSFADASELEAVLDKLLGKLKPIIAKLPQLPGQREARYMHLLCGQPDLEVIAKSRPQQVGSTADPELVARVEALEKQVAWLMEQLQ